MSYVSKREKVFDLPEREDTSMSSLKNAEARLKSFPSVSDRRAWTTEEQQRYQHLYGIVSGSETNVAKSSSSFKYIPFDVLLSILMAEKDAYIQELLDRQDEKSCSGEKVNSHHFLFKLMKGGRGNYPISEWNFSNLFKLYRAEGFEDSDDDRDALIRKDAEMVSLKNKIAGLESELEDYRETLTKAMHKLENMDSIIMENNLLREKLKFAEENIECLEQQKSALENEIWNYKRSNKSDSDVEDQIGLWKKKGNWEEGDRDEISSLASERDFLKSQVEDLQKELERAKANAAEINILRTLSETTSNSLEEITKENKNYKKKLEAMKYLEKHVEELKQEAYTLTDKYKRESEKANDQLKRINMNAKELQALREERDKLQRRVDELVPYESQYHSLQSKLHKVEIILDENEMLNKKLMQLDKLEQENERLKIKIYQLENNETQATADKERIFQLQCEIVDQEEEIQRMMRQIENLSDEHANKNELYRLRKELEEKNGKLKHFEQQVTEIPVLESEIEELKNKLQKCIDDFKTDKDLLKRLQEELEACKNRCQELEELAFPYNMLDDGIKPKESAISLEDVADDNNLESKIKTDSKEVNTDLLRTQDAITQSPVIEFIEQCVEAKLDEVGIELEELKERNQNLKIEVEVLTSKLSEINFDDFIRQTNEVKELLKIKEEKIVQLEAEVARLRREIKNFEDINIEQLQKDRENLKHEIEDLKEINEKLMEDIINGQTEIKRAKELEKALTVEKKARIFATNLAKDLEQQLQGERKIKEMETIATKLRKEEENMERQEFYQYLSSEIKVREVSKVLLTKIIKELKEENKILREFKEYSEKVEIFALKSLNKKLRAKVKALKNLSKPELQAEYESVQEKVRLLLLETDNLISEINGLRAALNAEKEAKDFLEKELLGLQAEIAACLTDESRVFDKELAAKDIMILELRKELTKSHQDTNAFLDELVTLREENVNLVNTCNALRSEQKNLKSELTRLAAQIEEQNNLENEINRLSEQIEKQKKIELELARFSVEINKNEAHNIGPIQLSCSLQEHKNLEQELMGLNAQVDDQKKRLINLEDREKNYINEIISLKKDLEEYKIDSIKFKTVEEELQVKIQELAHELISKEEEVKILKELSENYKKEAFDSNKRKEEKEEKDEDGDVIESDLSNKGQGESLKVKSAISNVKKTTLKEKCVLEEKYALEKAIRVLESEFDDFRLKLSESNKTEEERMVLESQRDELLKKLAIFEEKIQHLKNKLNGFDSSKGDGEKSKEKIKEPSNSQEFSENLSDLLYKLEQKRFEVEDMKAENENLKRELSKAEGILEISKKLHKTVSQIQTLPLSAEFFTPPAFPSPRSTEHSELDQEANDTIPMEVHKKELIELENHFKLKIEKMKEANSKKIKKLTAYHEKDVKCRVKTFNDSINNMKSNYENDIRKLVEKHKTSIAKLQELHEEEIKELNRTYEIQMVAMERQNEDLLNDMKIKSFEKCKSMEEQHVRELHEIRIKHDERLKELEVEARAEKKNLESNSSQTTNDLEEVHKKTVDSLNQFYQKTILELEDKHDKELKKCKKNYLKMVQLMENKYEDLLVEERKKYEEQLEEMLERLKKGQPEVDSNNDMIRRYVQRRATTTDPSLEFVEVLRKILNEGLESLTFQELILVHSKTCFIPEIISDREERGDGELNEFATDGCRHKVLMDAEKEELLKRIFTLEREIVIKQLETHEAIVNMEAAEKYRIQDLKKALSAAQQNNYELNKRLTNQSRFQTNMKIEKYMLDRQASQNESTFMEKVKELEREKAEKKRLEEDLQRERANVKNLSNLLESEKKRFSNQRKRDSDYVDSMRLRLEEALKHEEMMESQLENEARFRAKLESELQSLQKSFNLIAEGVSVPVPESKPVKDFAKQYERKKAEFRNRSRSSHKSMPKVLLNS